MGAWGKAHGYHWAIAWHNGGWRLNIPYAPHKILVIARGRLMRSAKFNHWLPCCYRMQLRFCCPVQLARTAAEVEYNRVPA